MKCKICKKIFSPTKYTPNQKYCCLKCQRSAEYKRNSIKDKRYLRLEDIRKENLIMENYKEPFLENDKKFYGYQGVIIKDKTTGMVQCNICGNFYKNVGRHLVSHREEIEKYRKFREDTLGQSYKRMFGLKQRTALCTKEIREKMILNALKSPFEKLGLQKGREWKEAKNKNRKYNARHTAEAENERGTCALQTLDKIVVKAIELEKTPSILDFNSGFMRQIKRHFGTYNEAIKILKLEKNGTYNNRGAITRDFLIECLRGLTYNKKRRPVVSDCYNKELPRFEMYLKEFGSWKKAKQVAFDKKYN